MYFHLCEVVQIFQRESIFCNKISSGGSLFIKKLVPGGTNLGGSIFTMTGPSCQLALNVKKFDVTSLINLSVTY